jgi:hypothetical protein
MVRVWQRQQDVVSRRGLVVPALMVLAVCGCKTSSWSSRPTWLGGSPTASALASAPAFEGGVAKPSETAKPYPTTSTPDGYALTDSTQPDAPKTSAAPKMAAAPGVVTYGSTPPPAAAPAAPSTPNPAAIATQVGPYAPLHQSPSAQSQSPSDPAGAVTAGLAAAPAFGGAAAPPASPSGERFADARGGGWGAPQPAQPPAAAQPMAPMAAQPPATMSRFSGGAPAAPPAAPAAQPQWSPAPPPAAPAAAPATPAPPADGSLPGAIPPPTRRPDPGYRPGGTSSYRPTRSLLAGEDEMMPVQPVSFDAPPQ